MNRLSICQFSSNHAFNLSASAKFTLRQENKFKHYSMNCWDADVVTILPDMNRYVWNRFYILIKRKD
jgi:hypothetical protein